MEAIIRSVVKSWNVFCVHIVSGDGSSGLPVMWTLASSPCCKNGNNVAYSTSRHSFQRGDQVCSQQRLLPAQNTYGHKHTHQLQQYCIWTQAPILMEKNFLICKNQLSVLLQGTRRACLIRRVTEHLEKHPWKLLPVLIPVKLKKTQSCKH